MINIFWTQMESREHVKAHGQDKKYGQFYEESEDLLESRNSVAENETVLDVLINRPDVAKGRISEFGDRLIETF